MLKRVQREQVSPEILLMPDQNLDASFVDDDAPNLEGRCVPRFLRIALLGLPLIFSTMVAATLAMAFRNDGQLTAVEVILVALMALLAGWEAVPSANAIIGLFSTKKSRPPGSKASLAVAILVTLRDESANGVIVGKLDLLRSLQHTSRHSFVVHVLSDSSVSSHIAEEQHLISAAFPLPIFYHHRPHNTDFKSGNIRNWIRTRGAAYDALIILDADSELDHRTAVALADALAADPACGLIQTVPTVLPGKTHWQGMQSIASRTYGELQGVGLSTWMGDEANYYGHNAILRTKAFAACAGLPHIKGRGLWNGTILSHDFVEAALLRRAGWAVRILPASTGSFEQAPTDIIAHLKRDARWCLGNFQHSRLLGAAGLHAISRFHLISGIFTYLSSAVWLATLVMWAMFDSTQTGVGGRLAAAAFVLIAVNLLLPRVLGVFHAVQRARTERLPIAKAAIIETFLSSFFAPSLMLQRVRIIGGVFISRKLVWAPFEKSTRNLVDYFTFHAVEVLAGLGLLASMERGLLTFWFLPLAVCLTFTPLLSWFVAKAVPSVAHEKLNVSTPL
jgi:membrane glycosyltransferase